MAIKEDYTFLAAKVRVLQKEIQRLLNELQEVQMKLYKQTEEEVKQIKEEK